MSTTQTPPTLTPDFCLEDYISQMADQMVITAKNCYGVTLTRNDCGDHISSNTDKAFETLTEDMVRSKMGELSRLEFREVREQVFGKYMDSVLDIIAKEKSLQKDEVIETLVRNTPLSSTSSLTTDIYNMFFAGDSVTKTAEHFLAKIHKPNSK